MQAHLADLAAAEARALETAPVDPMRGQVHTRLISAPPLYQNGSPTWGGGIVLREFSFTVGPGGVWVVNNLIADTRVGDPWPYHIYVVGEPAVLQIRNNLLFPRRSRDHAGVSPVLQDPLFVDAANADFHLRNSSPACDAGTPLRAPGADYDGNPRPIGRTWDIGAYENPAIAVSRISNFSILTSLTTSDPSFAVGTVVGGDATTGSKPLLVRAVGPSLAPLGVADVLADPMLELFSGPAVIASNDDWGGSTNLATAFAGVGAFALPTTSKDAALLVKLPPGNYTAQVGSAGRASGRALVEVYEVP